MASFRAWFGTSIFPSSGSMIVLWGIDKASPEEDLNPALRCNPSPPEGDIEKVEGKYPTVDGRS